ncbi:uncharacterized protein LOC129312685 [Prosopis cineraria]|uniref:uncharacterized protein LOC129312685 n=1 Tax=Prosopis cineraria TaxID=364024 RepID=UPI00240F8764|nr:uncharacterized protein LOC129312685 [Prosopis cineraria]
MVCGGYSVMGSYVFTPVKDKESKLMEQRLDEVRRKLIKTKAKKATHVSWLRHFMEEEEESELEHVAFLSLWLSRFVFPPIISKQNFSIALHLARGTRIALAPVVLASIYRDLTLLKGKFDEAIKSEAYKRDHECGLSAKSIILRAPFQLVQIWAFERFPAFHLKSNIIEYAQPLTAKWHKVKLLNCGDVSLALDSSAKSFLWQPYKDSPKLYNEKDGWVCFNNSDSQEDLESFARCLRHSQLVGIDCMELYLPHRVAMQFGLDQDIPEKVAHCEENNPEIAWRNYDSPMTEAMLCISAVAASSTLEPSVTYKYLEWWKQSKLGSSEQHGLISKPIKFSEKLSQTSPEMGSPLHRGQTGNNSDQDQGSAIAKLQKRSHPQETDHISIVDGAENVTTGENMNVVGQSKRGKVDAKMENVIDNSGRAKEGKFGENGNIYLSDLETRIEYLERVVAQLKTAIVGPKYGVVRAKTSLS